MDHSWLSEYIRGVDIRESLSGLFLVRDLVVSGHQDLLQPVQLAGAHRVNQLREGVFGSGFGRHHLQNHVPQQVYGHLYIVVLRVLLPTLDPEVEVNHVVLEHRLVELWALKLVSEALIEVVRPDIGDEGFPHLVIANL